MGLEGRLKPQQMVLVLLVINRLGDVERSVVAQGLQLEYSELER